MNKNANPPSDSSHDGLAYRMAGKLFRRYASDQEATFSSTLLTLRSWISVDSVSLVSPLSKLWQNAERLAHIGGVRHFGGNESVHLVLSKSNGVLDRIVAHRLFGCGRRY